MSDQQDKINEHLQVKEKIQEAKAEDQPKKDAPETADSAQGKPGKKVKKKKTVGQEIMSWIGTLLLAVLIAMLIRNFLFEPIRVDGASMLDTLQDKEIVLVTKPSVLLGNLKRGDVVICRFPHRVKWKTVLRLGAPLDLTISTHEMFVKRLVALPGDSVAITGGVLYINDQPVQEDYITRKSLRDFARMELGVDEYMVIGDNRNNSHDSRSSDVGPISKDMIVGKASFVLLPFNKIRTIK